MAATDDGPDELDEEAGASAPSARSRWLERIMTGAPPSRASMADTPRGRRKAMERLDERERRFAYSAALAAVVFAVAIYVAETHNHHFKLTKGQLTPQTTIALGLGAFVLLALATYSNRRAPVVFVCLFTFFVFSNGSGSIVIGLPYMALGGWLLYRSFQIQRRAATAAREGSASSSSSSSSPRAAPRSKSAPERSTPARQKPASRGKDAGRPVANKRYTPKRPPPPAPKPSRRERKAAEAKE
jgi:hypothetical protein